MARTKPDPQEKRIIFIHPDLGIGGAERLVIDAAVGLQTLGHKVVIFTSHCDKNHCFSEARDGTLQVHVRGDSIPPTIFGRFAILCAILRQIHLILEVCLFTWDWNRTKPTHVFIDQLSAGIPLLRVLTGETRILFYCHFPDKLLAQRGTGLLRYLKAVYRLPFNLIEAWTTNCADGIVVNSKFTASVVKSAFTGLRSRDLQVVYPCVDTDDFMNKSKERKSLWPDKTVFLSINRFERKKDVGLAIKAFARLGENARKNVLLVIAGGYDNRVAENVAHLAELETLAGSLNLSAQTLHALNDPSSVNPATQVLFMPSVTDKIKQSLLLSASLLIYTPRNEHFGIVPLEAMLNEVPVLAADEGGPTETVVDELTGWLRDVANVEVWGDVMENVLRLKKDDPTKLVTMGRAGKFRVEEMFSKQEMATKLDEVLTDLSGKRRPPMINVVVFTTMIMTVFAVFLSYVMTFVLFHFLDQDAQAEAARKAGSS